LEFLKILMLFAISAGKKLLLLKEKYYCSRSCANSRRHSEETKVKISKGVVENLKINSSKKPNPPVDLICKKCNKKFTVPFKKRQQMFCSRSCARSWKTNSPMALIIKDCNKKKINYVKKPKVYTNETTFIYTLEFPVGNIRYVGKSNNPNKRLKNHIKEAKMRNKNHKDKWINSLSEAPIVKVIEEVSVMNWEIKEKYWIKYYKDNGYNLVNGTDEGEGSNGFLGKTHTIETKVKLARLRKGKKQSQETKDKVSGENSGRCKIKDDDVRNIFNLFYKESKSCQEISIIYSLNKKYIYQIITGKKRKKIFDEFNLNKE